MPSPIASRRSQMWFAGIALLALCLFPVLAQAQVLYGSLTGNVTDQSGAALPKASVEALNVGTGVAQTIATDATGLYRFNALQAGTYKVTISASGFANRVFDQVPVTANGVQRVDAQLGVASQQQTVEVTSEAPVLQTDKADVHTDLTATEITNMPIAGSQGRNFQTLLRIIPGAALPAETNSLAGNPQRAIFANVNGQSQTVNNTRIDGAQDIYPWLPSNVAYVPPADAIETVNVVTNSMDAEQGQAGGAAMNVQIKSGTNSFHGSAHEFHFDQNLAARDYFQTNLARFPKKNRNNQNQFGGTIGGPILHDKLFFFADYERTTQRQLAGPDTRTLPIPQMVSGDFRNLPGNPTIFDPATGDATGRSKTQISCNGVANVVCANRIDPAAAAMIKLLQPEIGKEFATATDTQNFVGSSTALFNRDTADFKINYNPTEKTTVFGRYSFSKTLVFDPPLLGDAVGDATNGGQLGNAPGLIQSIGLGATHTFTPSMLLDWNFGFTRLRLGSTFDLTSAKGLNDLKIPGTNNAGTAGDPSLYYGLPGFIVGGLALGNAQPANPFVFRDGSFVSGANLSWNVNRHQFRYGIEWNHSQMNHFQPQVGTFNTPRGAFNFSGTSTSLFGTTPTWFNQWADFLLGLSDHTGKAIALQNPNALRWNQWAWYIRDQWQVTPKLTATIGIRWEFYPFGYSDNGKGLRYLNLQTFNVLIGGYGTVPRNDGVDVGHGQFLPRVGLAYRLTSSTVLRAGYGMSSDSNNWRDFRSAYPANLFVDHTLGNSNAIAVASLTGLNATIASGAQTLPSGVVLSPLPDLSTGSIPMPTSGVNTTTIPQPFRRGYIHNFNFMVQQEWKGFVLNTGYVGARGIRPLAQLNMNASPLGTGAAGGLLSQALGKTINDGITGLVPFKNNWYDSMQTKLTRRLHDGSIAGVSWTWSKTTDYADNDDLGSVAYAYPAYFNKGRAVAGYDRTHNVSVYGVLQLPFGRGHRWAQTGVGNAILGGWQINPLINYLTGLPFTVSCPGAINAVGSGQTCDLVGKLQILNNKPNRDGICPLTDMSCRYFDPSAFAAPLVTGNANAHFGNTNRNEFRGPGYFGTNLSLARQIKLTERFALQIRADAINFTNTPHFANPGNSCPSDATKGANCSTGTPTSTFGAITGGLQPGGFFGPDHGARQIWLAARLTF